MRVFISYKNNCQPDVDYAATLYDVLVAFGHAPFRDEPSLDPGEPINGRVTAEIDQCDCFVCLLSDSYLTSLYCLKELRRASQIRVRILPLELAPLDPDLMFTELDHVLGDKRRVKLSGSRNRDLLNVLAEIEDVRLSVSGRVNTSPETVFLGSSATEKLLRLHQASTAHRIEKVIDNALIQNAADPRAFSPNVFSKEIHTAVLESRQLCKGFRSDVLGDIYCYFEERFSENELALFIQAASTSITNGKEFSKTRRRIVRVAQSIIEKVFDDALDMMK